MTIAISELPHARYQLIEPIPVTVERAGREWCAGWEEGGVHMTDRTRTLAVASPASLILDFYDTLLREEARLGPFPAAQLAVMRRHIRAPAAVAQPDRAPAS